MNTKLTNWHDPIIEDYPEHLAGSDSWAGHIPFAFYLMGAQAPKTLVELGVFAGNSLFAFAQAAKKKDIETHILGIDTWASDPHSGGYDGEIVYQTVCQQQSKYAHRVALRRQNFDAVRPELQPQSIDLLHIDGYHHYDAVSHDFHTWIDAVSPKGIVLFHDTSVRRDDFGVWRFWGEIQQQYGVANTMEFPHSNGLGVLFLGSPAAYSEKIQNLRELYAADPSLVQAYFKSHGDRIIERFSHLQTKRELSEELQRQQAANTALIAEFESAKNQLSTLIQSKSWRLTAPLRVVRRKIKI